MDPITMGAVLLAVATGVSEALGGQLWAGVVSLVRRPLRGREEPPGELPTAESGETQLAELQESPADQTKAVALAEVLLARASGDPGFEEALRDWWARAEPVREKTGNVTNMISGGTQHGPVLQGRDFSNLSFGVSPLAAPPDDPGPALVASEGDGDTRSTISGGTQSGPVLQGRDFIYPTFITNQAAAAPVARDQLPAVVTGFTGREAELGQLAGLLDPAGDGGAVVVSAVAGLAGVGKTALVVQAGHAALEAGWFPGGVLFLDLHGYDDGVVQSGQALDSLLRALGVPGEHIPSGAEERAGLYRSVLAQITEPVLVIADNASSEAQVRLLLPGPGPHRVVVTSRHTLAGLGARLVDVTVLDEAAGVALLDEALRAVRPGDDRITADRRAGARLAGVCGGLPLALRITGALLVADPALAAGELADELGDEVHRLEALRYDDGGGTSAPSVAAAFELSYRKLDHDSARMFRLLSTDPGPDASTDAAAALMDWPTSKVRALLGRLVQAHLVEPAVGSSGRWRMHDLLRLYTRQISGSDENERKQAIDRLLTWYVLRTVAANAHLLAQAGTPVPPQFADREDALAWLDAQRSNLIAVVAMAAADGRHKIAATLPQFLSTYLLRRRRFDDWLAVLTVARDSSRRVGSRSDEAAHLNSLGLVLREVGRFEEAISAHRDAVAMHREDGDRHREGIVLGNLGAVLREVGRFEEAISAHQHSADLYREAGDRRGGGTALNNLGAVLREVGRFEEAISAHRDAVAIFREAGDGHSEGIALNNLGTSLREVGQPEEAILAHRDAVANFRASGDRHPEGEALDNLGLALREVGRFEEAILAHRDAVVIFREAGDRHRQGMALNNLGRTYSKMGQPGIAAACWREAVAVGNADH
jgi:tetratricopeptide (TPR) repeat protein